MSMPASQPCGKAAPEVSGKQGKQLPVRFGIVEQADERRIGYLSEVGLSCRHPGLPFMTLV